MGNQESASISKWIKAIRKGDRRAMGLLYGYLQQQFFPVMRAWATARKNSREDAEDWFQDAFLILIQNIVSREFQLTSWIGRSHTNQIGSYMMGIVKNMAKNASRKKKKSRKLINTGSAIVEQSEMEFLYTRSLELAAGMSSPCRELLQAWYSQRLPPPRIGKLFKMAAKDVRNQMSECMKALLQMINADLQGSTEQYRLENLIQSALGKLDDTCRAILSRFYSSDNKKPWEELADELGILNEHAARTKKYECMKALNRMVGDELLSH